MPFKSEAQRRYLYANEPEIASKWTRETKVKTQLPERAKKKRKKSSLLAAFEEGGKRLRRG
jgi:hypothetical protein